MRMRYLPNVVWESGVNFAMGIPPVREMRLRRGRTVGNDGTAKFLRQFEVLRQHSGENGLRDLSVLEIGPGDVVPIGLLAIGAGAAKYHAVDRFFGDIAGVFAKNLYRELADAAPADVKQTWRQRGVDPDQYPWTGSGELIQLIARPLEEVSREIAGVDVVFSYNVLEHITDVDACFQNLWQVVRPGGRMVHRVDFGPHGYWLRPPNPLEFLSVPRLLWHGMGSNRGTPNRVRFGEMMRSLERVGFHCTVVSSERLPFDTIQELRPRLAREFRGMTDEDLSYLNAIIIAERPA